MVDEQTREPAPRAIVVARPRCRALATTWVRGISARVGGVTWLNYINDHMTNAFRAAVVIASFSPAATTSRASRIAMWQRALSVANPCGSAQH